MASKDHLTQQPRVNYRLGSGAAKADYSKPATAPPPSTPAFSSMPSLLLQRALKGDPAAILECSKLLEIPVESPDVQTATVHPTIEYSLRTGISQELPREVRVTVLQI